MGEVYRARDTRLDRTVAIKILPAEFALDSRLRARFEREAKTISSLNHPHICALYDVGPEYLVMEHCEGKTLAQRIADGRLPLDLVLQYGIQIADALDKAHRQGIIHRDLKPSNIILTKSGVKLLDFGLAKQHVESSPAESTIQKVTEEGKILGTIQYMAPELFHGKEADARSDIFALGLVLHEMITGKPAFTGTSKASLIAAILEHQPPPTDTPPPLDRLIRACLAKDPDERIQTAHDVALQLEWISEQTQPVEPKRPFQWSIAVLGLMTLIVGADLAWRAAHSTRSESGVQRFSIPVPAGGFMAWQPLAVSPDGARLVYEGDGADGRSVLYVRSLNEGKGRPIAGTEGANTPFFSPDGKWLAFFADRKLKKISLSGGGRAAICDLPLAQIRGAAWGGDDTIVYGATLGGLFHVSAAGGLPRPLTKVVQNEASHRWPQFLPDGEHVLFTVNDYSGDWDRAKILLVSLKTGERRIVVDGDCPRYAEGFLLFARFGTLFAAPFDLSALKLVGQPVPVVTDLDYLPFNGIARYAVAASGPLFYVTPDRSSSQNQLVWVSRTGTITPISDIRRDYEEARLSPDNKTLVVDVTDVHDDLWTYDFDRQSWARLTSGGDNNSPLWSPDGKQIIFSSSRNGPVNLFTMSADGNGLPSQLTKSQNYWLYTYSSTPDGRFLTIDRQTPDAGLDIMIANRDDGLLEPFQATSSDEGAAVFSPDVKWCAYQANESGRWEVYVRPFHGPGKWIISVGGGRAPLWRRDGRELFYRNGDKFYAVDVQTKSDFHAGKPHQLFDLPFVEVQDVSADGRRFVAVKGEKPLPICEINVVLGWTKLARGLP